MDNNLEFKTISIDQLPEGAWTYITGKSDGGTGLQRYYQAVPWLFRGVDVRSNAVSTMPFSIYKGEDEYDSSEDYQNKVGFLPNPAALLGLVEAALTIWGYAYNFKERNAFIQKGLRYLDPNSITVEIQSEDDKDKERKAGEITFIRTLNGKPKRYTTDDIIYYWKSDPFVEIGPPQASPVKAAVAAAGVLLNIDEFASAFFKRGAVKTTLLTTTNIMPAERERLKSWWSRVLGIGKAWQTDVVNAETVKPVVIGEGLESLENTELSESKRTDIAAALGIPFSVLFSNASNKATAEQDDLHLYTKTIIPECRFIEQVLNTQLFQAEGLQFKFTPENLDVFQEDENERAASLAQLITALENPAEFLLAADILGYEINPDTLAKIEALVAEKEKRREEMAEVAARAPAQPEQAPGQPPQFGQAPAREEERQAPPDRRALDLEKWRAKALKRVKSGRGMVFSFESDNLDPVTIASISGALEEATTEGEVKALFDSAWVGYP